MKTIRPIHVQLYAVDWQSAKNIYRQSFLHVRLCVNNTLILLEHLSSACRSLSPHHRVTSLTAAAATAPRDHVTPAISHAIGRRSGGGRGLPTAHNPTITEYG